MHSFYSNIHISVVLFQVLIAVIWFPAHSEGLSCQTCEDCTSSSDNKMQCVEIAKYEHEPDGGKMGCSWETVDKDRIRKRCSFSRKNPDTGEVSTNTECYSSVSGSDDDCMCYTDDCNKMKPKPSSGGNAVNLDVFGVSTMIALGLFSTFFR